MKILITGANGFIGKNLVVRLQELNEFTIYSFTRDNSLQQLSEYIHITDVIVHLAGANRPDNEADFNDINFQLTQTICQEIIKSQRTISFLLASSIQAENNNQYGKSKLAAEQAVQELAKVTKNPVYIYRLANVFGKWCKPNYNSVVATFCHNIANDKNIKINDKLCEISLVYVDDVINNFISTIKNPKAGLSLPQITPLYSISLGQLANKIYSFKNIMNNSLIDNLGKGLTKKLYSTYLSYTSPKDFSYDLQQHADDRGTFVEVLKNKQFGQISYFTIKPGITRGGHYHHTKSEKFIVVQGRAKIRFQNLITFETYQITCCSKSPQVVNTIPGWVHDITNVSKEEAIVLAWANDIFNKSKPDTISCEM